MARKKGDTFDHYRGTHPLLRKTSWWRAGPFMAVNLLGFVVVCAFWQYLASGRWVDFSLAAYAGDLRTPVGQIFLEPLPVLRYPWMILVTGLLLAVTVSVPIIAGVLYHLRFAALFVVTVVVIGHAPVLAGVTALGCLLAARTRLRSDMPFVAALLGILPVAAYLYVLGFLGANTVTVVSLQRWLLYAPFVIALVGAVIAAAIIFTLASVTGYRPGIVWPVLLLMSAGPVATFYLKVGPDELAYCLTAQPLAAGDALLEGAPLGQWILDHNARGLKSRNLIHRVVGDMKSHRTRLARTCRDFLERFPDSPREPEVLWILARCESLQLDRRAYESGMIRYTSSYPLPASAAHYRRLIADHGQSPQAALARLGLAQLTARDGDAVAALAHLHASRDRLTEIVAAMTRRTAPAPRGEIFMRPVSLPTDDYYTGALLTARRLLCMIEDGGVIQPSGDGTRRTDERAAAALAAYLRENPHQHPEDRGDKRYSRRLRELADQYADTKLAGILRLSAAGAALAESMVTPSRDQAAAQADAAVKDLLALAARRPVDCAALGANYVLGQAAVTRQLPISQTHLAEPQSYLQVVVDHGDNPWRAPAARALEALTAVGAGNE